jgi:hypothetical protein
MSHTPVFSTRQAPRTQPLYRRVRHLRPTAALRREPALAEYAEYIADDTPVHESDVTAGAATGTATDTVTNRSGR